MGLVCACAIVFGALQAEGVAAAPGEVTIAQVRDINPAEDPGGSSISGQFATVNGTLFFAATDGTSNGVELWRSDGSQAGTTMVKNINPSGSSSPQNLTAVNDTLFFVADSGSGVQLWKSDGTRTGTVAIPAAGSTPGFLTNLNGALFFEAGVNGSGSGAELWKSDGTAAGTAMVKDINPAPNSGSNPGPFTNVNGTLYFSAIDGFGPGDHGEELWKSDGTTDGTTLVADINPTGSSSPQSLTNVNGTLYFTAADGSSGFEPWRSNGGALGPGGTERVADINPTGSSFPAPDGPGGYVELNGTIFFRADDGAHDDELWKSTPAPLGTGGAQLVADINPSSDSFPGELTPFSGGLYFRADDGTNGFELWRTNGGPLGPGGTELVKNINPAGSSTPQLIRRVDGRLFFSANDGTTGIELWSSGGNASDTLLAANVNPGPGNFFPQNLTDVGGVLFFSGDDGTSGTELWKATIEGPPAPSPATIAAPTSAPTAPAPPAHTGKRAAALKKCKKKRTHEARKRCRKHASHLPV